MCACEGIAAVDVHGTGAADALATGTPESQSGIDLVLDLDQRIQNHWPAVVDIDLVSIDAGILRAVRIKTINRKQARSGRTDRRGKMPTFSDF
jgi:hypothetical protein